MSRTLDVLLRERSESWSCEVAWDDEAERFVGHLYDSRENRVASRIGVSTEQVFQRLAEAVPLPEEAP